MEEILLKLLSDDNATIQQATSELKVEIKKNESTAALCRIVVWSQNPQVRQYAAVLLRQRYGKGKQWSNLPQELRQEMKQGILQALMNEPEKSVKNAIAQLVGVLVKHELPANSWPEVLQLVQQLINSDNPSEKELGTQVMCVMTEIAPGVYTQHAEAIVVLLAQTLNSTQDLSSPIAYNVLRTLENFVPIVEHNQALVNRYHEIMPRIMLSIQALTTVDAEKAVKAFELLDELCENAINVLAPHIKALVSMCLSIAGNKELDDELKTKAVSFVGWLVKKKKKSVVKQKLVEPVIDMLFSLMSSRPDDENDEVYFNDGDEDNTPTPCAAQTLDLLASHLPPEKLIPYLSRHIEPALQSPDIYMKKAAYLAIAVIAEGCSEYIRTKCLESFLRCICQGITDGAPVVRNAALFALGQFSEHLQPDIAKYSAELLPVLFEYLAQICAHLKREKKAPPSVDRMFYALEMFCENLNESLLPYLPTYMERVFEVLASEDAPVHVKELCLSAIGAAACASKEHMLPYFERIVGILNGYLVGEADEETMCLRVQAVDTLGVIARTIGEANFAPLAAQSLEYGMKLLKETEDPDLKKAIYGLFASISTVMKKEMAFALPQIVEYMMNSVQSSEGIVLHFKDEENCAFPIYEESSASENDEEDIENTDNEDDDDDVAGYSVENAYIEEKEEAILALTNIAKCTEEAFLPYLPTVFEKTLKLSNYPQEDIRCAVIEALLQFCINFAKIEANEQKDALLKALSVFVPKLSELIRLDDERSVAISGLEALAELLKNVKEPVVIGAGHKEAIMNCVRDVMKGNIQCQDQEHGDDTDAEAEHDELLIEYTGDVLPSFGKVIPPEEFAGYFQSVLPMLLERLHRNKPDGLRSYASGTIAECFSALKEAVACFVPQILPVLLRLATDRDSDVRNNALYGIGELVVHGKTAVAPYYNDILKTLGSTLMNESNLRVRDNALGAIARLIITDHTALPLEAVFPPFVNALPLQQDYVENKAVFKALLTLYQAGNRILEKHIGTLLKIALSVMLENKIEDETSETKDLIVMFVKAAQRDFANDWNSVCAELSPDVLENVRQMFS